MGRADLRWDDVRIFLAVQRRGSMAAAARELEVDQTTIGRRLKALEDSLDARLFDRLPDGLVLTPAGEGILAAAEQVETSMLELERRIAGEDARVEGTVRITTSETFAAAYLIPRLPVLRARLPSIVLELELSSSFATLARREADLAIRQRPAGAPAAEENVVRRKLFEVAWGIYASPGYLRTHAAPCELDDLTGHDVVDYDTDAPPLPGRDWLAERVGRARVVMRATTILAVAGAARAGLGLALLPTVCDDGLVRVGAAIARADAWLLVHPDLQRVARVRAVFDALVELARADAARVGCG